MTDIKVPEGILKEALDGSVQSMPCGGVAAL